MSFDHNATVDINHARSRAGECFRWGFPIGTVSDVYVCDNFERAKMIFMSRVRVYCVVQVRPFLRLLTSVIAISPSPYKICSQMCRNLLRRCFQCVVVVIISKHQTRAQYFWSARTESVSHWRLKLKRIDVLLLLVCFMAEGNLWKKANRSDRRQCV